jgi:hypothetical protein
MAHDLGDMRTRSLSLNGIEAQERINDIAGKTILDTEPTALTHPPLSE